MLRSDTAVDTLAHFGANRCGPAWCTNCPGAGNEAEEEEVPVLFRRILRSHVMSRVRITDSAQWRDAKSKCRAKTPMGRGKVQTETHI